MRAIITALILLSLAVPAYADESGSQADIAALDARVARLEASIANATSMIEADDVHIFIILDALIKTRILAERIRHRVEHATGEVCE